MRVRVLSLLASVLASPAVGTTFVVDSTADVVDAVPGDGSCDSGGGERVAYP